MQKERTNHKGTIVTGPARIPGLLPPYVPGTEPCTVPGPCDYRKEGNCHNDCECPHDPEYRADFREKEYERLPKRAGPAITRADVNRASRMFCRTMDEMAVL